MGLSKTMKTTTTAVNKNIGGLFTNKYFLYFMLFLAITSILGYLQVQNFHAIIFFMLIGFLTFQFCKNMSIVLLTSIIATSLYVRMQNKNIVEGLVNKQADDGEDEDDDDDDDDLVDSIASEFIIIYNATSAFQVKDLSVSQMSEVGQLYYHCCDLLFI